MENNFPMSGVCCVASLDFSMNPQYVPGPVPVFGMNQMPRSVSFQSLGHHTTARKVPLIEREVEESWLSRLISMFQVVKKI